MENIILWLFGLITQLLELLLSIKIIGQFSFLHILGGIVLIKLIIKLITFGTSRVSERSNMSSERSKQK